MKNDRFDPSLNLFTIFLCAIVCLSSISLAGAQQISEQVKISPVKRCAQYLRRDRYEDLDLTKAGADLGFSRKNVRCRIRVRVIGENKQPIPNTEVKITHGVYGGSIAGCSFHVDRVLQTNERGIAQFTFTLGYSISYGISVGDKCILTGLCCLKPM